MKRASSLSDEEANVKRRYHSLLDDFLELQKEFVSRKRKLNSAKQKRDTILAEVRFLRHRRQCLLRNQSSNAEKVLPRMQSSDLDNNMLSEKRNHSANEATPPKDLDQVLALNSHLSENGGGAEMGSGKETRFDKEKAKSGILIQDKSIGKRKTSQ